MEERENVKKSNPLLYVIIVILLVIILALIFFIFVDRGIIAGNNSNNQQNSNEVIDKQEEPEKPPVSETKLMSENEALELGNQLWKYAHSAYWGNEPAWNKTNQVCNTTREEVKAKFASDFVAAQKDISGQSSEYKMSLDEFVSSTPCQSGRGSDQLYKTTTLSVKDIQEDKVVYMAKSEYCGSSFCIDSNETVKIVEKEFIIKKQNDNWLISYFYLPN